jgi:multiple sugar transport system substrate-binding protein
VEDYQPKPQSAFNFKPILVLLALLVILGGIFWAISSGKVDLGDLGGKKDAPDGPVTLEYWGLLEPQSVMQDLIAEYQESHSDIKINYQKKTFSDLNQYKTTLQVRTQQGTGPDIFRFHATWTPDLIPYISPASHDTISVSEFEDTFYSSAVDSLVHNDRIYGIPLMYDGLALLYDPVRFEAVGIESPPETWMQFREAAVKLTEYEGEQKKIKRAGAAIGVASNVAHASDIFGLMLAQNGVSYPDGLDTEAGESALTFYTTFVDIDNVWSDVFPNSLQAFANGQVAMIFAPSWRIFDILSFNPRMNLKVAPVPQVPRFEERYGPVGWASFWAEGVSKNCASPEVAWDFLKFLTSQESQRKLYSNQAALRPFGEFYARRDMREFLMGDTTASAFLEYAETAVMWPLSDSSGNARNVEAVETAIGSIFKSISESAAMKTLKANLTGQSTEE